MLYKGNMYTEHDEIWLWHPSVAPSRLHIHNESNIAALFFAGGELKVRIDWQAVLSILSSTVIDSLASKCKRLCAIH
jgi:hypothetical protein